MRLKHLLLSTLLFVLVRSNKYTSDYKCQHDGYSAPDGSCTCTDYYGKKDCSQIQCINTGVLSPFDRDLDYDQRCSCPPGFLGLHCEPVQCVDGEVKSFDLLSHARDVSVIITYNAQFQAQFKSKDKGPPIQNTICDAVFGEAGVGADSRIHFYLMEIDYTVDNLKDCKDLFEYAFENSCTEPEPQTNPKSWSCEGLLTTKYIQSALDQMGEDSRLIIISNLGIDDYTNDKGIQGIRKKAISMRIQVHSLVISPRTPEDNIVYFQTGYKALRELSESTMGFFINPFDGSGGQKLGDDGITQILKNMMPVFFEYVVVDRLVTNSTSCNLPADYTVFRALEKNDAPNIFWLTVISNSAPMTKYTTDWIGGPVPKKAIDAGYFNAYTLNATYGDVIAYKPFSVYGNQKKCVPTNVMVLAKSAHLARFAITYSEEFDATSPYAISGDDAKNILVGHFTQHYHEENLEKLHLEFSTADPERLFTLNLDPFASPRSCQYNAKFGEVSCNDGDDTFIRVRDYDSGAAVTVQNLYCSPQDTDKELSSAQLISRLDAEDGDAPAPECKESPIKLKENGKRALIVSAHATETIFELFNGNKNSAIRYFNDLDDLGIYGQYILNIYNGDQVTNAQVEFEYEDFKAALMGTWHQYTRNETTESGDWVFHKMAVLSTEEDKTTTEEPTESTPQPEEPDPIYFDPECTASVSAVVPLEDLTSRFTNALPNSDIIFIYDRAITILEEEIKNVLKDAYTRRLRLIVLLLGCEDKDFSNSDALKRWNSIAARTGGFASHFSQPSDLNKFLASYVDFVKGQAAASIDNKETSYGFVTDPITSTPFQTKSGGNYAIIVNSVPVVAEATLSTGAKLVNPTILGNSIALFNYMASDDETLTVKAAPPQYYFFYASIRVLDMNEDLATIGFTKSKEDSCVEKEYPDYTPHEAQYPITSASADDSVKMTLFDSAGVSFRTGAASGSGDNFVLDYNWRCTDNENIFYISADVTLPDKSSFTRLFTTECIGESDGIACVNGEQSTDKKSCICPHDYTGDVCEIPVCQNGGEVTSSLECQCKDGYKGFFCESYDKCTADTSFVPDFQSIASTIIFLVERSDSVIDKLKAINRNTFDNAKAAQYIIVQYGNKDEAKVLISTTDKAMLYPILTKEIKQISIDSDASSTTPDYSYFDAIPAITLALKAQVTSTAHLFWFAESDSAEGFVKDVLDTISHQRVTITALFSGNMIDTPIHPVQLAGGMVFYDSTATTYDTFFAKYIAQLLQFQSIFEFRPNLLSSATKCNAVHKVNIDQSTKILFVAANGAAITINSKPDLYTSADIPGGKVFTFKNKAGTTNKQNLFGGGGEVTVTITGQDPEAGSVIEPFCSSTVTSFSQIQVEYRYIKEEKDTNPTITTHKGEHFLVTYWTSESAEDTPTPTATVTPISLVNGFGNTTTLYTTVRNDCSFSLSVPVECNDEVDAVGVTMSNWVVPNGGGTAYKVDKYISVLCPEGSCEHGNQTASGDCECDPFWGGDYCNQFLCNNGVVVGDICSCYVPYTGEYCDEKVDKDDRAGIAFLIIQDVCGDDDDLKDTAQTVLTNYVSLLKTTDNFYLGTNSPDNTDVLLVKSVSELTDAMTANRAAMDKCSKPTLGAVLDNFYAAVRQPPLVNSFMFAAASDPAVGNARVAHVTTVGVDSSTGSDLYKLATDFTLTMEFVGVTYKNEYFPNPNAFDQFADFSGEFLETYDPEVALLDLVNAFGSDIKPSFPPGDSIDRCIQNLQAAIVFHTDISNVPNGKMNEYRTKAQKIFNSVTKYFTIPDVKTIDIDDDTCEFDKSQMENRTLFYGSIYANQSSIITPTFCMSNMDSYPKTVGTADYKQAPLVNLQKVVDSYTKWYNTDVKMKCHCFDYQNPETTKIILWTPLWPESLDTDPVKFDGFELANFTHVVMPFGFNYEDSPLWNNLVPDRDLWLTDASAVNYDEDEIIQDIWTIICRLADHIDEAQTAEPFNPYTTKKPRTGEDPWKKGEVTDDPSDGLPR